jgi:hypothetical protein
MQQENIKESPLSIFHCLLPININNKRRKTPCIKPYATITTGTQDAIH